MYKYNEPIARNCKDMLFLYNFSPSNVILWTFILTCTRLHQREHYLYGTTEQKENSWLVYLTTY